MPSSRLVGCSIAALLVVSVTPVLVHQASASEVRTERLRVGTRAAGDPLVAWHRWRPNADERAVVISRVSGAERRGYRIVRRVLTARLPASVELWALRTINPERAVQRPGNGRETRAVQRFLRRVDPDTVVVIDRARHGAVAAPRTAQSLARPLARAADLRLAERACATPCRGSLLRWSSAQTDVRVVHVVLPRSAGQRSAARLCSAVLRHAGGDPARPDTRTVGSAGRPAGPAPARNASTAPTGSSPSTGGAAAPTATGNGTSTVYLPPVPPRPAGAPFLPYSSGSYFRSTIGGLGVDPVATASFRSFMTSHPDQRGTAYPLIRGVDGNSWGTAYAEGGAADPVWRLTGSVPSEVAILTTQGFRAPEWFGSMLTGTSDSPFVVVDRATGWSVWGAKARVVGDHLVEVDAAGLFVHASNGLDRRSPFSDSSVNFRSRGAIPDAMVIRRDLVSWGVASGGDLGHVLHLFMVETDSSAGHVHPMVGHESGKYGWGAEGQRIAIDPGIDLTTRGLSPEALVVARTLQRYGAYLGDNSGGPTALKAEQESAGRPVWVGRLPADSLRGLSWEDFVVVSAG